jgi:anti-anti-sigma regulatory factor
MGNVEMAAESMNEVSRRSSTTLMNGVRRLTRQRRRMVIVCPPGPVRRVFELLGLVGTFHIVDTREEAVAAA